MGFRDVYFLVYILLLLFTTKYSLIRCASGSYLHIPFLGEVTFSKYKQFDWDQKVKYLDSLNEQPSNEEHAKIIRSALDDEYDSVTLAVLRYASRTELSQYRKDYLEIASSHYDSSVKVQAMEIFLSLPVHNAEAEPFISISEDKDWVVREKTYQIFRIFTHERKEKKYYEILRSRLNEKNHNVLKELFKTLIWYDKKKSFRHLYNRSLHYHDTLEFIFMLRELSVYVNRRMLARFKKISKKHPDFLVREEVKKILEQVYEQ